MPQARDQAITFRELIAPIDAEEFFAVYYRQKPLFIPAGKAGAAKFAEIFSWAQMNDLLAMTTLWSDHNCEVNLKGDIVDKARYCYQTTNRDNERSWRPDFRLVFPLLEEGASLMLNFIEKLSPGLQSLSTTLASVLCAPVNISAFCSMGGRQGYASHFDTTNVFACHIEGKKVWRVYEGRHLAAAHTVGGRGQDLPQSHHESHKGKVLMEVEMNPGDLLYIPHGQYHDATVSGDASLHVSCAVRHMVAQDFLNLLMNDLPNDPLFRRHLPPLDAADTSKYRQALAQRLGEIMLQPDIEPTLRRFEAEKAFEREKLFQFPQRRFNRQFRVLWLGTHLAQRDGTVIIKRGSGETALPTLEGKVALWAFDRDYFSEALLYQAMPGETPETLFAALRRLGELGLVRIL